MTFSVFFQVMASAEKVRTEKLNEELKATKENNEKLIVRATVLYKQIKVNKSLCVFLFRQLSKRSNRIFKKPKQ